MAAIIISVCEPTGGVTATGMSIFMASMAPLMISADVFGRTHVDPGAAQKIGVDKQLRRRLDPTRF
jgi:hypothetical protein